jgi:hypothetical protein
MRFLRSAARWILFIIRNKGRYPDYPFEDDCAGTPLVLHAGSWGRTEWHDPSDGSIYTVTTIDSVSAIAESMEKDIYYPEYQDIKEKPSVCRTKSPYAIGFWPDDIEN